MFTMKKMLKMSETLHNGMKSLLQVQQQQWIWMLLNIILSDFANIEHS